MTALVIRAAIESVERQQFIIGFGGCFRITCNFPVFLPLPFKRIQEFSDILILLIVILTDEPIINREYTCRAE